MADYRRVEVVANRIMSLWIVFSLFALTQGQLQNLGGIHNIGKMAGEALQRVARDQRGGFDSRDQAVGNANDNQVPNPDNGNFPPNQQQFGAPGADQQFAANQQFGAKQQFENNQQFRGNGNNNAAGVQFGRKQINQNFPPPNVDNNQQDQGVRNELNPKFAALKDTIDNRDRDVGGALHHGNIGAQNKSPSIKLTDNPQCRDDIKMYCSSATNNFAVLDCLQNDLKSDQDISVDCQHVVWNYKRNLTHDIRFQSAAKEVCKEELNKFSDCKALDGVVGNLIPCLIDYKQNITIPNCKTFLTKMASIVFGDFRLIYKFVDSCRSDIDHLDCGRLHKEADDSPHSQGRTVECLSEHVGELETNCKHEILRIAELQADDYHLDRPLFYACRDDRERLCSRTKAGSGKVYHCLMKHKFDRDMSSECREKLTQRQKLMHENYKVNRGLAQACQRDIMENDCIKDADPGFKHARLSKVVLCLESVMKEGRDVEADCVIELKEVRKSLMEDYKITPEIVSSCAYDINNHCNKGLQREGKTLHCLMDLARPKHDGNRGMVIALDPTCQRELELLLKEADVGEDWTVDPALREACQHVVQVHCDDVKDGEGRVLSCLMEHIDSNIMTAPCEERLMEIHYFLARDFSLDPRLYKFCHEDAVVQCGAKDRWHRADSTVPEQGPLVFACLYRHMKLFPHQQDLQLSRACAFEVRRVLRQRAISVDLEPRIEDPCMGDLGAYCSDDVTKGEEVLCLQRNYEELTEECQWAVGNFTEDEDADPNMDKLLMESCTPMIKKFCDEHLHDTDPGVVMQCLIEHKDDSSMDERCAAGIEHHQLITLNDYHFSVKFKEACKDDVIANCKGVKRKSDVIQCLSQKVRDAVLLDEDHTISRKCRKQLSFELLQRSENIKLDPDLEENCQYDVAKFCSNLTPGRSNVVDCLKKHHKELSETCSQLIFKREEDAGIDITTDFLIMHACKRMIKHYCMDEEPSTMFKCLVQHKKDVEFDGKCRKVIIERMRQKNTDIRFSPILMKSCIKDIHAHCEQEVNGKEMNPGKAEGQVIRCLKVKFAQNKLSESCREHLASVIKEAEIDYKQDPAVAKGCKSEISTMCMGAMAADDDEPDGGRVIECLKDALAGGKITIQKNPSCIKEIARVLAEDKADIQVDPLLYKECALDIKHYCFDVPRGEGRQMSCLLAALDDSKVRLRPTCHRMLEDRVQMWSLAAKVAPPETIQELLAQLTTSTSRNYFLGIIFSVIGIIFIGGLMCGRVTKRIRAEVKNSLDDAVPACNEPLMIYGVPA